MFAFLCLKTNKPKAFPTFNVTSTRKIRPGCHGDHDGKNEGGELVFRNVLT